MKVIKKIFLLMLLFATGGCCSINNVVLSPTQYTVSSVVLEFAKQFQQEDLLNHKPLKLEALTKSRGVRVHCLPTLHLQVGETVEADNQESVAYAKRFDSTGHPSEHATVKTGWLLRAVLSLPHPDKQQLSVLIDNSEIVMWKKFKGHDGNEYKYPVCRSRKLSTTVYPNWGEWQRIGDTTGGTETDSYAFFVRVDRPTGNGVVH